jgi:Fe-S-cluster containining protein
MSLSEIQHLSPGDQLEVFNELKDIYRQLEKELDQIPRPCEACGECCQFDKAEHRLYGSGLELAFLNAHHPISSKTESGSSPEDRCPHQKNGKCTVREHRLIGCRTYYRLHAKKDRILAEEAYERALDKVKCISNAKGLTWEYRDLMSLYR